MSSASAPNTHQGPQTGNNTQHNVPNAALQGAAKAFAKPPVKPKPQPNLYTGGGNGALLAATKVGTPRNSSPSGAATPVGRDWSGGSARSSRPNASPTRPLSHSSSSSGLTVPDDLTDRGPSPSNIAAKLAAARYTASKPAVQATAVPQMADDTPIAPTTSLVKMFEQNRSAASRPLSPVSSTPYSPSPVRSPKPQRKINLPPEPKDNAPLERQMPRTPPPVNKKSKPRLDIPSNDGTRDASSFGALRKDSFGTPPKQKQGQTSAKNTTSRPTPPPKKFGRQGRARSEDLAPSTPRQRRFSTVSNHEDPSSPASFVSAQEEQEQEVEEKPRPTLPPPRRSARQKPLQAEDEVRPKTATPLPPKPRISKSASPIPPPQPPRRNSFGSAPTPTNTLYHSNYQRESVRAITKHMTGENLSNAIVGAALASSRNASPNTSGISTPPTIPARKQQHHHSPFHRSPSPLKPQSSGKLRTTMRKEPSSSSDEDQSERYKRKGTRIMGMGRKHPNKHHEGTRKRWRDQVTERERKRYEGLWAANKGILIQSPTSTSSRDLEDDPMYDVHNLVIKEIWMRSRLPDHDLEEVWDLVDGRGVGRLRREEFVVGMWLVDQRLKGRKIPAKVTESVWASVTGAGVKIKVGRK
ncbi:hypothetical protein P280DRAFT_466683 [Massarina eburnea CBS 473.64]|uniref:EH domain-containing protein n=1 Tax=Massarina eburnea CBS 473.64 TaxID=1395130 RepID=A0A6A6S9S6_9PLEO|nr:hypothetical protein P280DRAFT_466683 [Massarina eburnea CBS 473.64]